MLKYKKCSCILLVLNFKFMKERCDNLDVECDCDLSNIDVVNKPCYLSVSGKHLQNIHDCVCIHNLVEQCKSQIHNCVCSQRGDYQCKSKYHNCICGHPTKDDCISTVHNCQCNTEMKYVNVRCKSKIHIKKSRKLRNEKK